MSISDATEFDIWLGEMHGRVGDFTALVVLVDVGDARIEPLCSTYVHFIGSEIDWDQITLMFAGSGHSWKGAAFFPTQARNGGPIDNPTARTRLKELEQEVVRNKMILNDGHFFDEHGRRIEINPA